FIAQITPARHPAEQTPTPSPRVQASEPASDIGQQTDVSAEKTMPKSEKSPASDETAESPASGHPPPESTTATDVSEAANLRQGIQRLQSELTAVQIENNSLREQIQASRKQALRFLLRVLAQPQTRLAQHAELWNTMVSLQIDEERKSVALTMRDLANDNLSLIKTWRQALNRLAESIPEAAQTDILPKPENQYFAWLIGTFHLRPASNESALMQTTLKRQLLDMEHNFSLGIWPDQKKWHALIAALHDQFGADADLGLPDAELLSPALQEIRLLHQTAAKWLEML
ncbi:MAG: hypothetical protein Q9M25_07000, partial [Mariprofundaceae bacterium]|nr:hypothetical protein [Mariprofundaceae bacterium]